MRYSELQVPGPKWWQISVDCQAVPCVRFPDGCGEALAKYILRHEIAARISTACLRL